MIQRVYAVVESGLDEDHLMRMVVTARVDLPEAEHWRDEKAVARALHNIAEHIATCGCGFAGIVLLPDPKFSTYPTHND